MHPTSHHVFNAYWFLQSTVEEGVLSGILWIFVRMYTTAGLAFNPHMVSLKKPINGSLLLCGGTVLSTTHTLTAAHCLVFGISGLILRFGTIYLFKGGVKHFASKAIIHPQFDVTILANDIAVVSIFPARLQFGEMIKPVKLPKHGMKITDGSLVVVYGWGATSSNVSYSNVLQKTALPYLKREVCQSQLVGMVPENTFCLGFDDGHTDACLGDSGGPAMALGVQVGIVSWGEGCARPRRPGVYTDLASYTEWLNTVQRNEVY